MHKITPENLKIYTWTLKNSLHLLFVDALHFVRRIWIGPKLSRGRIQWAPPLMYDSHVMRVMGPDCMRHFSQFSW
jgi:hypothetical protein